MKYRVKTFSAMSNLSISVGLDMGKRIGDWLDKNPNIEIVSTDALVTEHNKSFDSTYIIIYK